MATRRKTTRSRSTTRRSTRRPTTRKATTRRTTTNRTARPTSRTRFNSKIAKPWTREEVAFLRKFYRNHETEWVARQLGRTVYSVRYKASDLSIKKGNPSTWKNPGGKVVFAPKSRPTTPKRRTTSRTKRQVRYAKPRTRRNNRRARF